MYCVLPIFSKNQVFKEDSFGILRCWTEITTKQRAKANKRMDRVAQMAPGDIPLHSLSVCSACKIPKLKSNPKIIYRGLIQSRYLC